MSLTTLRRNMADLKEKTRRKEWVCPLPIILLQIDKERDLWRGTLPGEKERVYTRAELEPHIANLPPSAWIIKIVHKDAGAPEEVRQRYSTALAGQHE